MPDAELAREAGAAHGRGRVVDLARRTNHRRRIRGLPAGAGGDRAAGHLDPAPSTEGCTNKHLVLSPLLMVAAVSAFVGIVEAER